jgi:hypothetical protein
MADEHIARISYGKDSLKMLDVIVSRGLPLDRITTTDVWATDTISANLPPVEDFKARMDEKIWQLYRINVEHLCARNPDGSKRTYEQMFYHVPQRRSQNIQVEREREPVRVGRSEGLSGERSAMVPAATEEAAYPPPQWRVQGTITGFPPNTRYNWCQKLKHQGISSCNGSYMVSETQTPSADPKDTQRRFHLGAESSRSTRSKPLFRQPRHYGGEKKYSGVHRYSS